MGWDGTSTGEGEREGEGGRWGEGEGESEGGEARGADTRRHAHAHGGVADVRMYARCCELAVLRLLLLGVVDQLGVRVQMRLCEHSIT